MLNVLLTGTVSFIITYLAVPAIMKVAEEKKLYDLPDARKLHTRPIASLGGVGIFLGVFLGSLLTISYTQSSDLQFFYAASLVIFFLGLKDDILILSPIKKFLGQMAAAAVVIHFGHVQIESMHGFLGLNELPKPIGIALSYATIIVVINAYNLIDGVDGLAGSLGVVTMLVFGTYFHFAGMPDYSQFAWAMAGGLIAFLAFNFSPARIFMGDSGSLLLGLFNAIMVIKFINVADSPAAAVPLSSAMAIGVSVLIVPLMDTLRVFSIRISKKRSPFSPDRNHIHHLLLDNGFSHKQVTLSCVGLNLALIAMTYFGRSFGSTALIAMMATVSGGVVATLIYFRKPAAKLVIASSFQKNAGEPGIPSSTKVVALKNEAAIAEK